MAERRMIEIRYSIARALRERRKRKRVTQKSIAKLLGMAPATLSHIERASMRVTLDQAVYVMLALEFTDADIAAAFNAGERKDVQQLRARMELYAAPRPSRGIRPRSNGSKPAGSARDGASLFPGLPTSRR